MARVDMRSAKSGSSWNMSTTEGAIETLASFRILCTPRSTCCFHEDHLRAAKGVAFTYAALVHCHHMCLHMVL